MRETFTTPDGLTLAYERRGSGPLLVCHPGGPGGSAAEFRDFAGLDDTFELVLLCPRGSLGSDPADDYSLASYASVSPSGVVNVSLTATSPRRPYRGP